VSNTFAGIYPADVPGFLVAQCVGALTATAFFRWLDPADVDGEQQASPEARPERARAASRTNQLRITSG
jgi:hypothetical protein